MKLPNSSVTIAGNSRVGVFGQTGSGKTVLSMSMLAKVKRLLVHDPKNSLGKWGIEEYDNYSPDKIRFGEEFRLRVVDNEEFITAAELLYKTAVKRDNTGIVYLDEVNALIPPRKSTPQVLLNIWQRGRELNVGGWAASQRPVSIPLLFLSEAEHLFTFRLNNEDDRKRIAGYTDKRLNNKVIDKYGFYYYDVIDDKLRYFKKLDA